MKLFLHQFPSNEAVCHEIRSDVYNIKFDFWEVSSNKTYLIQVMFKWCDVKVKLISVSLGNSIVIIDHDDLETFKQPCIELFSLFNKFDEFYWLTRSQIPRTLAKSFYDVATMIHSNQ